MLTTTVTSLLANSGWVGGLSDDIIMASMAAIKVAITIKQNNTHEVVSRLDILPSLSQSAWTAHSKPKNQP